MLVTMENSEVRLSLSPDCLDDGPRREWDNLGHMVCWHNRYTLGDEGLPASPEDWFYDMACALPGDCRKAERLCEQGRLQEYVLGHPDLLYLDLFLFDHSGLAMSTSSRTFRACDPLGWDWGQVGYIYVTKDELRAEFGVQRLSKARLKQAEEILRQEVAVYNMWLQGDVWAYTIESRSTGEILDSCGGCYGIDALRFQVPEEYHDLLEEVLECAI